MKQYDLGHWWLKIESIHSSYQELSSFINNKEALNHHYDSITMIYYDENNVQHTATNPDSKKLWIDTIDGNIADALKIYSNQVIVLFVSIIDLMITDLIKTMFVHSMKSFFDIIDSKEFNNLFHISLKTLYQSESKEEIVEQHADIIAKYINSGSIDKTLKRIEKISQYCIPEKIKESVIELYLLRNRIVHELEVFNISDNDIRNYFNISDSLRIETGKLLLKMKIEFNDPANWMKLNDF